MLKNYFKIAWRNLMRHKVFSFINIFGLTVGLTSFLLIALYIFDELTFDSFHTHADNIYRLVNKKVSAEGKEAKVASVAYQISEAGKTTFPEIIKAARFTTSGRTNVGTQENTNVFYENYSIANSDFLEVLDFDLLSGNRKTALTAPNSVVLTEESAMKYFNSTNVIGKAIKVDGDSLPYTVTAVLKDIPVNSHISFNIVFSESSITGKRFRDFISSDWSSDNFTTYLLLDAKAEPKSLESKLNQLIKSKRSSDEKDKYTYSLQPIKDIHFYSNDFEGASGGNLAYIYIFAVLAVFVLVIACINYMNLTTARFANRAREIGVRKTAGATRENLIKQFIAEAFMMTAIALFLALLVVQALLPYFNNFTHKELTLNFNTDYRIWVGVGIVVVVASLMSGMYPALFQSSIRPILLLKNKINVGKGSLSIRRLLVIFQFSLSIIMIVATAIVYLQMRYIDTKDMGFKKDQLVIVDINSGKVRRGAETIKREFAKLSQVKNVSVSSRVPGEWKNLVKVRAKNENITSLEGKDMYFLGIDDQFVKTYDIQLVKGRNFTNTGTTDSTAVIINESAAKQLGITQASNQIIEIPSVDYGGSIEKLDASFNVRVVGIVKDFNFQSLHQSVSPMILGFRNNPFQSIDYFSSRVNSDNISQTLKQMDNILHSIDADHLFEYHFLDKQWDLFYQQDQIQQTIFLIVAILTILIACLGLFGLATYAAEQRIKEIGVRKVLGASIGSIIVILTKDFVKLVLIAALIAFPIAWWAMHNWLQDFAYHIDIKWWVFALAGMIAITIALLTISYQTIRAALMNPVKSLKSE
ncbi:ABC transporter permease [Emticicia sp. BO119]|uniref:ABC transporter permease n=1 Tax=Emticicia sp. BO119 TaxID=2757768 RepID=UPI0015F0B157|nr:ABC transporter permease [Emticicia sp. BO119]MBA4850885.1 ABC transporter permease [Emticicia sp. BO119]